MVRPCELTQRLNEEQTYSRLRSNRDVVRGAFVGLAALAFAGHLQAKKRRSGEAF